MTNYENDLNEQQLEVVKNGNGPCLVLAGAGSGKTRVITYRVARLLEDGVAPEEILLLTFTNKAAAEMVERVQRLTNMQSRLPWSGTFHGICNKILRSKAGLVNFKNNFTILDEDDSKSILKQSIREFKPGSATRFPSANIVKSIISYARNAEITIQDAIDLRYEQWMHLSDIIQKISSDYHKKKKASQSMDFDDLLVNTLLVLNNPEAQKKYSSQFKHILVDEYQDTNKIQAAIIRKMSLCHNNVLVVGDDAQSIYSFRAATIENILEFEKKYASAKVYRLEINYRSSQEILDVANDIISNNIRQYEKKLKTLHSTKIKPELNSHHTQQDEARFIIKKIKEKTAKGTPMKEIAVLFRAAFHSQALEMELMKNNIPYEYRGGLRFFERAHIKDVISFLRILNNPADTTAWMRVLTMQEGVGIAGSQKIINAVMMAENIDEIKSMGCAVASGRAQSGWLNFCIILDAILNIGKRDIGALIETIKNSSYVDYLESEYIDATERLRDIDQMIAFSESYQNLSDFLSEVGLHQSFNRNELSEREKERTNKDKIVLSTIHQAKGLEWETVFVINLTNGAFPSIMAFKEANGIEEERRLFYVATTRAKKYLHLTYPMQSVGYRQGEESIFLSEIRPELLNGSFPSAKTSIVFNDSIKPNEEEYEYVNEETKSYSSPGSFLIDVDDF
ncbi:MAG: ATP-dependent helicase [bacterium]